MLNPTSKPIIIFLLGLFILPINLLAQSGGQTEIQELSSAIKDKQGQIEQLYNKIDQFQKQLDTARTQSSSLKNQIYILETQIEKKQVEIKVNEAEIASTNLEIQRTEQEIKTSEDRAEDKKAKLSRFLREIYADEQKTDLEIILLHDSISSFFNQIQSAERIQSNINYNLIELKQLKTQLEASRENLNAKKDQLNELNHKLIGQKGGLEDQQYIKADLLSQTRRSEKKYQSLVAELKLEQSRINAEIVSLEKSIRAKLSSDKSKLSQLGEVIFSWPVPSRYVTAYFHDPDYPFRHIFEHPAIDIRASQGTPLRAAASGYVAKVRDGGKYGYSYIMLIHNNGFATVYGHVNQIYVKTDQFVTQGEVIGATGGMPGTRGAGPLTTGPHLHFEVRLNGVPVNPLDYLP